MTTRSAAAHRRPRWGALYTLTIVLLTGLAGIESAGAPSPVRTLLEFGIVVMAFAGMIGWTWCNRAALDTDTGCECVGSPVRVSVAAARPARIRQPAIPAASLVAHDEDADEFVATGDPARR